VYLWLRFLDLARRNVLGLLGRNRMETWLFLLEIALFAVPTALLFLKKVRLRPEALYACAVMVVFGFIANRLNVGITALEAGSGVHYVPKWSEIAVTLSIVAVGFATFRAIAGNFPIFEAHAAEPLRLEVRETEPNRITVA
jgi:Ni/Fe-hydrogenase subunit HybB-like protein